MTFTTDQMNGVLTDPSKFLAEMDLIEFVRQAWHVLEPGKDAGFIYGWAVEVVAEHLQAITEGKIRRLLINIPPGCTKSMLTNVFWPAWEWGPRGLGHYRYISASVEQTLATRDLIRCRDLVLSDWYQKRWGPMKFKDDVNEKTYYANDKTGWRRSVGFRGNIIGNRGDRIVVDDPHDVKGAESETVREEGRVWFSETLPTRLNKQSESAIVVIMQRLHTRDVSGLILGNKELNAQYTKLILPMEYEEGRHSTTDIIWSRTGLPFSDPRTVEGELLWPERFPRDSVEELKSVFRSQGGTYAEAGQLQQRPVPRGGGDFKRADFQITTEVPQKGITIRGWDLAASKDKRSAWTVGVKMHRAPDAHLTILDVCRFRGTPHEVDVRMRRCAETDGRRVIIDIPQDPGAAGKTAVSHIVKNLEGFIVRASLESGDKEFRAGPFAAQVEAGNVSLLRRAWNDDYLNEAELFPSGDFMDQIDASSRAHAAIMRARGSGQISFVPPTISMG